MTPIVCEDSWISYRQALSASAEHRHLLHSEAEKIRHQARPSVVEKAVPAPSGDYHDYVSRAPYWWPDPAKPDGLPYIRRDGQLNPENVASDRGRLDQFCDAFTGVALVAEGLQSVPHAEHAGKLLRTWFLDGETRMNPHLRYAQAIPGRCEGRCIGLIDTCYLIPVLDLAQRLPFGTSWTSGDFADLQTWFATYLDWLLESNFGHEECRQHNNHGTWFDAQIVWFSLFCGRHEIAAQHLEKYTIPRLAAQIAEDGSQPHELARTLSFSYSTFNLIAFALLARAATLLGNNAPWHPRLTKAIHWMLPYFNGAKLWTWEQIHPFHTGSAAYLLELAARETGDPKFAEVRDSIAHQPWSKVSLWRTGVRTVPDH